MYDVSMSDFEEGLETYLVLEDEKWSSILNLGKNPSI
jgi:hypothetical protein